MQTQLAAQLQHLQVDNADTTDFSSILFSPQEASELNLQAIYSIARNGIMELIRIDPQFARFDETLFGNKMLSVNRLLLTEKENDSINEQIRDFLFSVAPYLLLKCTQKTLEYLVRRFYIHTMNAEEFFLIALPYHESPLFPRILHILTLKRPIFRFLDLSRKAGTPLVRLTLSTQCVKDLGFFDFILSNLRTLSKQYTIPIVHLTFICSLVADICRQEGLKEEYVRSLVSFASTGFLSSNTEFQATGLFILSELSLSIQLTDDVLNACFRNYLKSQNKNLSQFLECLLIIFRSSQSYLMPEDIVMLLLQSDSFDSLLMTLSLKVSVFSILRSMIPSFCSLAITSSSDILSSFNTLLSCVRESDSSEFIHLVMEKLASLPSESLNNENIEKLLLDLSSHFSGLFDQYLSNLNQESPLKTISSRLFYGSSHMLLSNGRTLYLSLENHDYQIRKEICDLILKQINEMTSEFDIQFMKSCIPSLLEDDFFDITQQILLLDCSTFLRYFTSNELIELLISILQHSSILTQIQQEKIQAIVVSIFTLLHSLPMTDYMNTLEMKDRLPIIALIYSYYLADQSNTSLKKLILSTLLSIPSLFTQFTKGIKKITEEKLVESLQQSFKQEENQDLFIQSLPSLIKSISYCSLFFIHVTYQLLTMKNAFTDEKKLALGNILISYCLSQLQGITFEISEKAVKKLPMNSLYLSQEALYSFYLAFIYALTTSLPYSHSSLIPSFQDIQQQPGHPLSVLMTCLSNSSSFYSTLGHLIVSTLWSENPFEPYCAIIACKTDETILLLSLKQLHSLLQSLPTFTLSLYIELFKASFSLLQQQEKEIRSICLSILQFIIEKSSSLDDLSITIFNQFINSILAFKNDIEEDPKLFLIKLKLYCSKLNNESSLPSILYPIILESSSLYQQVSYLQLFENLPYSTSVENNVLKATKDTFTTFTTISLELSELLIKKWKLLLSLFFEAMTHTLTNQQEFRSLLYTFISSSITVTLPNQTIYSPITDVLHLINGNVFSSMNTPEKLSLLHAMFAVIPHHPSIDAIEVYKSIIQLNIPFTLFVEEAKTLVATSITTEAEAIIAIQLMTVFIEVIARDPRFNKNIETIDPLLLILNRFVTIVKEHTPKQEVIPFTDHQQQDEGEMEVETTAMMSDTLAIFYPIQLVLECLYVIVNNTTSTVRVIPEEDSQPPLKRRRHNSISIETEIPIPPQLLVDLIHLNLTTQITKTCLQLLSLLASMHNKEMNNHLFTTFEELVNRVIKQQDEESFSVIINILTYCLHRFTNHAQLLHIYQIFLSCVPYIPYSHSIELLNTLIDKSSGEYFGHILTYLLLLNNSYSIMKKESMNEMDIENEHLANENDINISQFITTLFLSFELSQQIRAINVLCCFTDILTEVDHSTEAHSTRTRDLAMYLINSLPIDEWKQQSLTCVNISTFILQFVCDSVSNSTFIQNVTNQKKNVEKSQQSFIHVIENLLLVLQNCSIHKDQIGEQSRGREKSEEENECLLKYQLLENCIYDSITVFSEVMTVPTLLTILSVLVKHEDASIRKRSLIMLNKKIEENIDSLTTEEINEFVSFISNLMDIWNDPEEQPVNKQTALLSFHILVQYFGADYSKEFLQCVKSILSIIKNTSVSTSEIQALKGSAYIALSMLCSQLGIKMLPYLPILLPSLLTELENTTTSLQDITTKLQSSSTNKKIQREIENQYDEICLLIQSLLSSLSSIITYQGSLLSSFLQRIIHTLLSPVLITTEKSSIRESIFFLFKSLSDKIEIRLLLPATYECYKLIDKNAASISGLFTLLKDIFDRLDEETVRPVYEQAWSFCIMGMEIRSKWGVLNEGVDEIEKTIVDALVSISLKLNENQLTPLFMKTVNWMEEQASVSKSELPPIARFLPFLSFVIEMSNTFKSIFTSFYSQFFTQLVDYLIFFNKACKKEKKQSEEQVALYKVIRQVVLALYKCFLYDSNGWMDEEKFKLVATPLVKCIGTYYIPNYDIEYTKFMNNYVVPTCVQLIISTSGHDDWWQQYNHEVLIQTRSSLKPVKLVAIHVIKECFERMSQEYLPLLPDVIPFLADLLEDEDAEVEKAAQDLRIQLESISGEELTSYLTM